MNPRCRKTWGDPEWDGHRTCRLRRVPCKDGPGRGEGVGDGERAGFAAHAGTILTDVPRTGRLSELNAAGVRSLARHPFSCQAKAQRTDRSWPHAAVRSPGRSPEFRRSLPRETGNHECKPIRQRHLRIHQQMDGPIFPHIFPFDGPIFPFSFVAKCAEVGCCLTGKDGLTSVGGYERIVYLCSPQRKRT